MCELCTFQKVFIQLVADNLEQKVVGMYLLLLLNMNVIMVNSVVFDNSTKLRREGFVFISSRYAKRLVRSCHPTTN